MNANLETLIALLVVGLGTARLTALIVLDEIFNPLRHAIFLRFPPEDNEARGWYYQCFIRANERERELNKSWGQGWYTRRWLQVGDVERKPTFIGSLISCHKCVGVWIAGINTAAYLTWPEPVLAVNFALAAAFLSIIIIGRHWR